MDRAVIYSLCFNASSQYVACSSDKGTVHVFSIGEVRMAAILLSFYVCVCDCHVHNATLDMCACDTCSVLQGMFIGHPS